MDAPMGMANAIEPAWYANIICNHPPDGFRSGHRDGITYFVGSFDLSSRLRTSPTLAALAKAVLPSPRMLFIGNSSCEYCFVPKDQSDGDILATVLSLAKETQATASLMLNLPAGAPFLSKDDNARSRNLLLSLARNGFEVLGGEVLWYVPIDFNSTDDFLKKLPSRHRQRIRRNLKTRQSVKVRLVTGGTGAISAEEFDLLFRLSENVVEASKEGFVRFPRAWHQEFFRRWDTNCRLFLYYIGDKLAGFTLGIISEDKFIFKATGLDYSISRKYNLYFVAWFRMLDYCAQCGLRYFIAGQSNDAIKLYLGAVSTPTMHAIYFQNPLIRWLTHCLKNRVGFGLPEGWPQSKDGQP
jgi:hypothetical protein